MAPLPENQIRGAAHQAIENDDRIEWVSDGNSAV